MTHFVDDGTSIPGPKIDWDGDNAKTAITNPEMYCRNGDYDVIRQAAIDLREWVDTGLAPGTYNPAAMTVDSRGRVTAISAGTAGAAPGVDGGGSDGAAVMDGVAATPDWCTLVGSVYKATRPAFPSSIDVAVGFSFNPNSEPIYVNGNIHNAGDIGTSGGNASGATDGTAAATGSHTLPISLSSGNSSTIAPQPFPASSAANGGASLGGVGNNGGPATAGTKGRGGGGGAGGNNNPFTAQGAAGIDGPAVVPASSVQGDARVTELAFKGSNYGNSPFTPGTWGGQGGLSSAGSGGGRGAPGGWVSIACKTWSGAGTWHARGGNGGNGAAGGGGIAGAGGGGGGAGGYFTLRITGGGAPPTIDVSGGTGGAAGGAGGTAGSGTAGGDGGDGHVAAVS